MILVIDVGNTNITFGVYEGKKLVTTFRMMSKMLHTSDEYGMNIRQLLMFDGISKDQIEGTIVASVVPNIMHSLVGGITRYLGTPPLIVGAGTKTCLLYTSIVNHCNPAVFCHIPPSSSAKRQPFPKLFITNT